MSDEGGAKVGECVSVPTPPQCFSHPASLSPKPRQSLSKARAWWHPSTTENAADAVLVAEASARYAGSGVRVARTGERFYALAWLSGSACVVDATCPLEAVARACEQALSVRV
jgi:hypothetical protein